MHTFSIVNETFRLASAFLLVLRAYYLVGCDVIAPSITPALPPLAAEGRAVFEKICSTCHSTTPDMVVVGPSLAGIGACGATRVQGVDAEAYVRDPIKDPNAYTDEGFPEGRMPNEVFESLTAAQFEAVVDYLMTLE